MEWLTMRTINGPLSNFDFRGKIIRTISLRSRNSSQSTGGHVSILHGFTLHFLDLFFAEVLFASLSSLQAKQTTNAIYDSIVY